MGKALEILSGGVTAPAATLTALTMAAGDSLTVRDFSDGDCRLVAFWATQQTTAGNLVLRSPRLHDNVRGITFGAPVINYPVQLFLPPVQKLFAQDNLICQLSGSAVAGDIELASLLVYYSNLPGIDARLITPDDLITRGTNVLTSLNTVTALTGPSYSGAVAINSEVDLMKANTDYALVGYFCSAQCNCVTWRGSDTGNIRLGGPGRLPNIDITRNWFIQLSNLTGLPCIPVINAANKSNTFLEVQQDENAANVTVVSIYVELSGGV